MTESATEQKEIYLALIDLENVFLWDVKRNITRHFKGNKCKAKLIKYLKQFISTIFTVE